MRPSSFHSLCAWTFNAGKGGFTPSDTRPQWAADNLDTCGKIDLVKNEIIPRLPDHIHIGLEAHYDYEYNEETAPAMADRLVDAGMSLAMVTPGAHQHFAYGGPCSLDEKELDAARQYSQRALDLAYGPLKKAWHPEVPPAFVIWNGSFGYDLATTGIMKMYANLKKSVAELCRSEKEKGGQMYLAIEPKPNEGHPAMLLPTVASAIVFWKKLHEEFGLDLDKKGVNKEFGHSEMIGLDHVYDTVEEIDNQMLCHMHINSQGYNDGLLLGGPGKYDIDNGARINGMNIAIAGLIQQAGYTRWKGHDMQVRAHDTEAQGIDRVIRSILSWDACEQAAADFDYETMLGFLETRQTAKAEDMMRQAMVRACESFDSMYN